MFLELFDKLIMVSQSSLDGTQSFHDNIIPHSRFEDSEDFLPNQPSLCSVRDGEELCINRQGVVGVVSET